MSGFINNLDDFTKGKTIKVIREFTEPYLSLEFEKHPAEPKTNSEIEMIVKITPNQMNQEHTYIFGVSKKEIEIFLTELKNVILQFPIIRQE